ncbi:YqjF family protein [Mucilaginibacter sp. RCC_168]|uniref:YqjF family protein n=1 Tax=Mucilaginibacter sp. RCC_168 TaxID=3239221 RepID=UPI003525ABFC
MAKRQFLRAQWKNLVMLNYEVDPQILDAYLPPGTVLDLWQGKALVSMVGFVFANTRMLGIKWPGHVNFEEVNLRFYVKYFEGKEWKRGAVFVSEIVPKSMIALIANNLYKEHYSAMPMRSSVTLTGDGHTQFLYEWKFKGKWNKLGATANNQLMNIEPGSAEEFILEHYWGYNKLSHFSTMEYQVEHISWQTGTVKDYVFEADVAGLYGEAFEPYLKKEPVSVFFAASSDIKVRMGDKIVVKSKSEV